MKVSDYIIAWGSEAWNQALDASKQLMAEMRGEKILPTRKLQRITTDIVDVLAKHGYVLKTTESYNAVRLAIGQEVFQEWLEYTLEDDAFSHVSWADLHQKHSHPVVTKRFWNWLGAKFSS